MKKPLTIVVSLLLITIVLYFVTSNVPKPEPVIIDNQTAFSTALSTDKKSIVIDGKVALTIDDEAIFAFFKNKSQLCDSSNIDSNAGRKMFCEDKATFRNQTQFKSIVISEDKKKVGFTIESDTLSPDSVVGIFYTDRATNRVIMLSNYYLGNEFISFSPSGANFVYKGGCFEAKCAFYIKDVDTLQDRINFIPKEADARGSYEFIHWISDLEIEYKVDGVAKKATLTSVAKNEERIAAGYVSGKVSIGPFCPVERVDQPCTLPVEAYTSRSVVIYEADQVTVKEKVGLDKEGKYTVPVGPGTYFLQIQPAGIGPGEKKKVIVTSFKTSVVDFDIDTGIR